MRRGPGRVLALALALALLSLSNTGRAQEASYPGPFERLDRNLADAFWGGGVSALFHLGAVVTTPVLALSDSDYHVHEAFAEHPAWGEAAWPAIMGGTVLPVVLPATLLGVGYAAREPELVGGGWASLQAAAIAFVTMTVLKAVTGRPPPHPDLSDDMRRLSKTFRFGLFRGGVFWGWPSGHAVTNTAAVSALAAYYADKPEVIIPAYSWAAYETYAVTCWHRGRMHWLSDAIAGALIGHAIGWAVGRGFRTQRESTSSVAQSLLSSQPAPFVLRFSMAL